MRAGSSGMTLLELLVAISIFAIVGSALYPVITGQTGDDPIFAGAADFDLELIETRTLDRNIQELIYRPSLHG